MQSRYGGVSEMQQFLADGCAPTLFTISPPSLPPANPSADIHARHHHPLHHPPHNIHPQPQQLLPSPPPPPPPSHFPHFHQAIPITQQLFQQTHHQFQLFHHPHPNHHHHHHHQPPEPRRVLPHHQLGMDRESEAPENSASPIRMMGATGTGSGGPPPPSFLAAAMNFKLAVNESSGGGSREGLNDDDGILQDDEGSESRFHPWQKEEESSIKEPFWRPLDLDYINRNSKDKEPETSTNTYTKKSKEVSEQGHGNPTSGSNYKLFSELEAIYKPGGGGGGNNQTGSGSALTGDENPIITTAAPGLPCDPHAGSGDHASDTSTGGGEPLPSKFVKGTGRKKRKRRHQQQMSSIAVFFEGLVKQLMDHQESLHRKFLDVMEKRDQERTGREEAWRRQEAAKSSSEATARAQERALAAAREAAIVSFLEKMTGESLNLPTKAQFQSQVLLQEIHKEDNQDTSSINPLGPAEAFNNSNAERVHLNTSRWPRAEVQALIRVRSGLESRFQEPGLKGPLWEEVSASMATVGYYRSSKRCKEKWENINKYFRKTKDSGKKRPQHSKTCPYFHQLDQLYSKSSINKGLLPSSSSSPNHAAPAGERRDNSELLDAILAPADTPNNFSFPELGYLENDYSSKKGDNAEASSPAMAAKGTRNNEDDEGEDGGEYEEREEEEMEGEGEGESQGQWTEPHQQQQQHQLEDFS